MSYLSENLYQRVKHWRPLCRGFSVHRSHLNRIRWSTTSLEGILLINEIPLVLLIGQMSFLSRKAMECGSSNTPLLTRWAWISSLSISGNLLFWHAMTRTTESYWMTVMINAVATRSTSDTISIRNVSISELLQTDFLEMQSDETVEVLARQRLLIIAYLHWQSKGTAFVSVHPCNRSRYDNRSTFSR